jgi:NADPH-dependent 2,4-dienoyl-CoA reductase/sulfur reductase-like enzyme/nitrite reductase/ring-hydroxylating ferredoxin subunit
MTDAKDAPDLTQGISIADLADGGILPGRVGEDEVIVVRRGQEFFAVAAHCTHYHGPLAEGRVVGETIHCPWHHACFDLRTGHPRAPALDPIACWSVERQGERVFIREKVTSASQPGRARSRQSAWPDSVVIVGGGAAGFAAAQMLRREGYDRPITMLSDDDSPPCDRPNLSKDYLAGKAQEDWIPLRPPEFYKDQQIDLVLNAHVSALDVEARRAQLADGRSFSFGALLIASGAEPVRLTVPGADGSSVHYLRSLADSNRIVAAAAAGKRALVVGASFIGLEVAASLRSRGMEVRVVSPDRRPMERIFGPEVGAWIQGMHESQGVRFHLGRQLVQVEGGRITLNDQSTLEADLVVAGIGVRPRVSLAEQAGLTVDNGIVVNEYLETTAPAVFAAGDVARWPDPISGERIRVEHWVVAERQGQTAARNMLGQRQRFDEVPFFWSQHYDTPINYVGHASTWDSLRIDGRLEDQDCAVTFSRAGRTLAVATIGRDRVSLDAEIDIGRTRA